MSKVKSQNSKVKVAFFDIDGTIFRSSLLIELVNELIVLGIFPAKATEEISPQKIAWRNRSGSYEAYINKVVEVHRKYIEGCLWVDVHKAVENIIHSQKNRIYRFTRDLIKSLKHEDYYLCAISASPIYLVREFAKHWGFDYATGAIYGMENGIFSGEITNTNFLDKEAVAKEFLKLSGINADLKNSIAVGDTDNDIPMLKMVGTPIAFNPNKTFAEYAKKNKWRVVVERKDAIYEIENFNIIPDII